MYIQNLKKFLGVSFIGSALFLVSCGNSPEDICSNDQVVNSIGTAIFGEDYAWLGKNYVKKHYSLSEEDIKNIDTLFHDYIKGKLNDEQLRKKIGEIIEDKISLEKLLSASRDEKYKNLYYCSAIIQAGDEKYVVDYEVKDIGEDKYSVKLKNIKKVD